MQLTRHVRQNRTALAGALGLSVFALGALLAPLLMPYDPWQHFAPFIPPFGTHFLGTDDVGRDILSELIIGTRVSLGVGLVSGILAVTSGVLLGLLAGFRRGALDEFLMGLTDIVLVIPALPLVILFSVYLEPSVWNTALVIGLILWPSTAR
ncbi:MAG TPA: ABC transporter permease, partial [Candidatus Hydrogenedentes bacterium]|nr:ABC transporter permease [Candidatus Hydrogenedentota bacterium]